LHVCEYAAVVTPKVPRFRHVSGELSRVMHLHPDCLCGRRKKFM